MMGVMNDGERRESISILIFVFGLLFTLLLFISLIRSAHDVEMVTFSSFLEFLSNSPAIIPNVAISTFQITQSWGIFDIIRNFINLLGGIIGFGVFVTTNFVNMFLYLLYFFDFIFVAA